MTTSKRPPTPRQLEILEFVRERTIPSGPTLQEIVDHFGFRSKTGALCHLTALERKGLIRRRSGRARGIEVVT